MARVSPRLWIGVCAVTLLTAGCQGAGPHDAQPTPTGPCNHWSTRGDPGLGAGFGYDESAHHPFDTPVPATMCGLSSEHVAITGSSTEIVVDPESPTGTGPEYRFTVAVSKGGAAGGIDVDLGYVSFSGPAIVVDDTGWSFAPWGDDA